MSPATAADGMRAVQQNPQQWARADDAARRRMVKDAVLDRWADDLMSVALAICDLSAGADSFTIDDLGLPKSVLAAGAEYLDSILQVVQRMGLASPPTAQTPDGQSVYQLLHPTADEIRAISNEP